MESAMEAVNWTAAARADLLTIVAYIADDNPDAAQALKEELETKTAALILHPRLYRPGRVEGTREMVVGSHYIVVYAERAQGLSILRVLHAARQWP